MKCLLYTSADLNLASARRGNKFLASAYAFVAYPIVRGFVAHIIEN